MGFREKEAIVYLALLALGPTSAYAVAQKSGLKKPTTYVILESLIELGYVYRIPRKGKQLFSARTPAEVFQNAKARFADAESLLPQLLALTQNASAETKTLFFENSEGVKAAYEYRRSELVQKEMLAFYASTLDINQTLNAFLQSWNKENAKLGIRTRAIVPDHPSLNAYRKRDKADLRTVKIVPFSDYSADISIDANEFFVRIVQFARAQAIIIDDPKVARTVCQIFELLWKLL